MIASLLRNEPHCVSSFLSDPGPGPGAVGFAFWLGTTVVAIRKLRKASEPMDECVVAYKLREIGMGRLSRGFGTMRDGWPTGHKCWYVSAHAGARESVTGTTVHTSSRYMIVLQCPVSRPFGGNEPSCCNVIVQPIAEGYRYTYHGRHGAPRTGDAEYP